MAAGGFLFAWSGFYSVAASRGHWAIFEALLKFTMRNSVERHAFDIVAPPLDSADLQALGRGYFNVGCALCHGAPEKPAGPVAQSMLPPPPDLTSAAADWKDRELFWIVKNGIKYTGMPPWASQRRDDEVWAVVAYLKQLNAGLDRAAPARSLAVAPAIEVCASCHGDAESAPVSGLIPVLHGQPREFLLAALQAYADGGRDSGIMQPIAAELLPGDRERVADYYARRVLPRRDAHAAASAETERLVTEGSVETKIPPCLVCHGPDALPVYPRLNGQNALYTAQRLRLWKAGQGETTATEAIMAPIARSLSDSQIDALSRYFAGQAR
jgi:cytochrome c553